MDAKCVTVQRHNINPQYSALKELTYETKWFALKLYNRSKN